MAQRAGQSSADDLPFYDGRPGGIDLSGWLAVLGAIVAAFLILVARPAWPQSGPLSVVPAIAFTSVTLIALALVCGRNWIALFRYNGIGAFGRSLLFAVATMTLSFAAGVVVNAWVPLRPNPVNEILAGMGPGEITVFLVATSLQLIGEEVVTILPLLAVMWVCYEKFSLSRRASLVGGVAVSTIWFSSMHLPTYDWNVIQCFGVIGISRLVMTWPYIHTKNLWVSAGAHDWSLFAVSYAGSHAPVGL